MDFKVPNSYHDQITFLLFDRDIIRESKILTALANDTSIETDLFQKIKAFKQNNILQTISSDGKVTYNTKLKMCPAEAKAKYRKTKTVPKKVMKGNREHQTKRAIDEDHTLATLKQCSVKLEKLSSDKLKQLERNTPKHNETFEDSPKHNETFDDSLKHNETFDDSLKHNETFEDSLKHNETFDDSLKHNKTFDDSLKQSDDYSETHNTWGHNEILCESSTNVIMKTPEQNDDTKENLVSRIETDTVSMEKVGSSEKEECANTATSTLNCVNNITNMDVMTQEWNSFSFVFNKKDNLMKDNEDVQLFESKDVLFEDKCEKNMDLDCEDFESEKKLNSVNDADDIANREDSRTDTNIDLFSKSSVQDELTSSISTNIENKTKCLPDTDVDSDYIQHRSGEDGVAFMSSNMDNKNSTIQTDLKHIQQLRVDNGMTCIFSNVTDGITNNQTRTHSVDKIPNISTGMLPCEEDKIGKTTSTKTCAADKIEYIATGTLTCAADKIEYRTVTKTCAADKIGNISTGTLTCAEDKIGNISTGTLTCAEDKIGNISTGTLTCAEDKIGNISTGTLTCAEDKIGNISTGTLTCAEDKIGNILTGTLTCAEDKIANILTGTNYSEDIHQPNVPVTRKTSSKRNETPSSGLLCESLALDNPQQTLNSSGSHSSESAVPQQNSVSDINMEHVLDTDFHCFKKQKQVLSDFEYMLDFDSSKNHEAVTPQKCVVSDVKEKEDPCFDYVENSKLVNIPQMHNVNEVEQKVHPNFDIVKYPKSVNVRKRKSVPDYLEKKRDPDFVVDSIESSSSTESADEYVEQIFSKRKKKRQNMKGPLKRARFNNTDTTSNVIRTGCNYTNSNIARAKLNNTNTNERKVGTQHRNKNSNRNVYYITNHGQINTAYPIQLGNLNIVNQSLISTTHPVLIKQLNVVPACPVLIKPLNVVPACPVLVKPLNVVSACPVVLKPLSNCEDVPLMNYLTEYNSQCHNDLKTFDDSLPLSHLQNHLSRSETLTPLQMSLAQSGTVEGKSHCSSSVLGGLDIQINEETATLEYVEDRFDNCETAHEQQSVPIYETASEQPSVPIYETADEQPLVPIYETVNEQPPIPIYETVNEQPSVPICETTYKQPSPINCKTAQGSFDINVSSDNKLSSSTISGTAQDRFDSYNTTDNDQSPPINCKTSQQDASTSWMSEFERFAMNYDQNNKVQVI